MSLPTAEPEVVPTASASTESAPGQPRFESWGRYPKYGAKVIPLNWRATSPPSWRERTTARSRSDMGRSYGDVCLLKDGTLLQTTGMSRLIDFDPATGVLTAEAGISLAQILDFAVPRGFFLPVTPGTKYVTLGGAIANDIHGKNHEVAGSFGNHVPCFELVRSDGTRRLCSPTENPDWYAATIGGMGLTGLITWAQLRLRPIVSRGIDYEGIQFHGIDEFLALKQQVQATSSTPSVGSTASRPEKTSRAASSCWASTPKFPANSSPRPSRSWSSRSRRPPSRSTAPPSVFNTVFFHKQGKAHVKAVHDYEPFFYPLDAVLHWNRMYGKRGLVAVPVRHPVGPREGGHHRHPARDCQVRSGQLPRRAQGVRRYSLARHDELSAGGHHVRARFSHQANLTFPLLQRLGDMTLDYGGRLYPAKDAAMTAHQFQTFYPEWKSFARFRDPMLTSSFWERVTDSTGA
jgi:hypothetical protein